MRTSAARGRRPCTSTGCSGQTALRGYTVGDYGSGLFRQPKPPSASAWPTRLASAWATRLAMQSGMRPLLARRNGNGKCGARRGGCGERCLRGGRSYERRPLLALRAGNGNGATVPRGLWRTSFAGRGGGDRSEYAGGSLVDTSGLVRGCRSEVGQALQGRGPGTSRAWSGKIGEFRPW